MTPRERRLERVHLLMTMEGLEAPATGSEVADLANTTCKHLALTFLPKVSRRSAGTKLNAMAAAGLLEAVGVADTPGGGQATTYRIATKGRALLDGFRELHGER